jgi:hypothetical protein
MGREIAVQVAIGHNISDTRHEEQVNFLRMIFL